MNEITFKEITDIKTFAKFASEIWYEYWPDKISTEQTSYMVRKFQSENAVRRQIKTENYVYFYIIFKGEKAGYTGLSRKEDYLFLSKLYIKKEYRNKGIGSRAFDFIKQYAKKNGYSSIKLTVNKYNTNTIEAYKKWKFEIIESVITDIGGGFVMDDYIMEYILKFDEKIPIHKI